MPGKFKRIGIRVPATATEVEAHGLVCRILQTGAERVAVGFDKPDDDWAPIWVILTKTQGTIISIEPGVEKYEAVDHVAKLARRWGAIAIGHLHSSWMVSKPAAALAAVAQGGSTEGLERDEIILVGTYTMGNAKQYTARIERYDDAPPTLAPFEVMVDTTAGDGWGVEGAMVTPLLAALQRVG